MPADGDGRNGVHAASLGWQAVSFGRSKEGRKNAVRLAEKMGVGIDYHLTSVYDLMADAASFDVAALIYAHFPFTVRRDWHQRLEGFLKPGGLVLLEAFSMSYLTYDTHDPRIAGPGGREMLYEVSGVAIDYSDCNPVFSGGVLSSAGGGRSTPRRRSCGQVHRSVPMNGLVQDFRIAAGNVLKEGLQ